MSVSAVFARSLRSFFLSLSLFLFSLSYLWRKRPLAWRAVAAMSERSERERGRETVRWNGKGGERAGSGARNRSVSRPLTTARETLDQPLQPVVYQGAGLALSCRECGKLLPGQRRAGVGGREEGRGLHCFFAPECRSGRVESVSLTLSFPAAHSASISSLFLVAHTL